MKNLTALRKAKNEIQDKIMSIPGVTAMDIGNKVSKGKKTEELAIRVYVAQKKPLKDIPQAERIPKKVGDIKTDVIQMSFKLHTQKMKVNDLQLMADTNRYDPLLGGISIGPCRAIGGYVFVGTLGAIVKDNSTGKRMMLSNYHVMSVDPSWSPGNTMAQPSRVDGGNCPADIVATLSRAKVGDTVDCAVAEIDDTRPSSCKIQDIGNVKGTAEAVVGESVRKRGRTTELTHGTVDSIDLAISINYDGIGNVILTNQIGINVDERDPAFGLGGDSGSVVVNEDNKVVGLYFAGNNEVLDDDGNVIVAEGTFGVANPIADVLKEMDVTMCTPAILKIKEWKEWKEWKEKEKEWKEWKEKEWKEWKEKEWKEKDSFEGSDDVLGNYPFNQKQAQQGQNPGQGQNLKPIKEFKEFKEWKEFKEKDNKEWKEFKVKDNKDWKEKDKDKDIVEGPGDVFGSYPFNQKQGTGMNQPFQQQANANPHNQRMQALENTVKHLTHFINTNLRPNLQQSSLKNEKDYSNSCKEQSKQAKAYKDHKDMENLR